MEAIKGIARRATQTVRDGLATNQATEEERILAEVTGKIHTYERIGGSINEKLVRVSRLYTELGHLLKSIAEDYQGIPDKLAENTAMLDGMIHAGNQLVAKGSEFQATLKEHAQNPISMFLKEIPKLRDVEEDRAKKKLEYEFFKAKVIELRKDPPKDSTRIPRNEQILEKWRVELWNATEVNKAAVSALYSQGKQVMDRSVLVMIQTSGNFVHSAVTCMKQHLFSATLPQYTEVSVLPPAPLPPNPMPPFVPQPISYGAQTAPQWQAWAPQQAPPAQVYPQPVAYPPVSHPYPTGAVVAPTTTVGAPPSAPHPPT